MSKHIKHIYNSKNSDVYTAINKLTGKRVILKTTNEERVNLFGFAKLQNEYAILKKINSRFVPEAIDYLKIDDGFYLVLDYCDGIPLQDYIQKHKISIRAFLDISQQIVQALSDIHNAGFIHKDLNPANIIVNDKTRKVTIIDFGLSTAFSHEKSLNLETTVSEGTLYYMSPEQTGRMNHMIDFRTDFYSLGVTFFEMLCGCHPFESENQSQIIYMHLAKRPPLVKELNPDVPQMLSHLIDKLMAKMPEDRYVKAEGILFDLNKCREMLDASSKIAAFELGTGDYSDHFEIPQKLYGRENEIAILVSAYQESLKGGRQLVTIAGHSGIGKTSLVRELYKPMANSNGLFISGKFDQYFRNIPYIAISQALEQFCDFILAENEQNVELWKERIEMALKQDDQLLVEKIPKLALLVGPSQQQPELSPLEKGTRLKAALQSLLAVIASPERPLVIFIDDIHLADMGSLAMIEEIMENEKICGLQIVACYRNNEVNEDHPLIHSINKMVTRQANIRQITLAGLALDTASQMLADAFHCSPTSVAELTDVIYTKTNGNPFYLKQFIKLCWREKFIFFNSQEKNWNWSIDAIKACRAEENVVDFLIRNVNQMPQETVKILSLGACIGQRFKLSTLFEISKEEPAQILNNLRQAVSLEVVYPIINNPDSDEAAFQFVHDRFQQTFYTILPDKKRCEIHYKLAVYYEKIGFANAKHTKKQFLMADNYSKAFSMVDEANEKRRVSDILLRVAHLACLVSAFDTAIHYLEQIIDSFEEMHVGDQFKSSVYCDYHLALCSIAKYDQADVIYAVLEELATEPIKLTDSCCLQAIGLSNRGQYQEAFMLGVALLEKLGVHFPADDLLNTILKEIAVFYDEINNEAFPGVESLPEARCALEFSIGKLLNRICTAGFFYNPLYSFWAIITSAKRVLENGYTPDGLSLYGSLTLLLIPFRNDYRLSYHLVRSAMTLAEKNGYRIFRMYHLFSLINCHWYEDLQNSIVYARESCSGNIAVGDFEFACFTYFTTQQMILETCDNLEELVVESDTALAFAQKHGNIHAYGSFISFRQLCRSLVTSGSEGSFNDRGFNEVTHLREISENKMALCFYYTLRALSAAIYLDFDTVFELTEKAAPLMSSITGFYANILHNFLNSLAICKKIESEPCSEEKTTLIGKLTANQIWLSERAADAPANYRHLYDLIEAEKYMLENKNTDSFNVYKKMLVLYEKAMIGAAESNRTYHYALACELAGIQFMNMDSLRLATIYLKQAHSAYLSWGATAKTEQMNKKYNGLSRLRFNNLKFKEDRSVTARTASNSKISITSGMFLKNSSVIDFSAIIRASQAISGETKLEVILERLISVLLENSGAQDIYYLIKKDNDYFVQAEGHSEGDAFSILADRWVEIGSLPFKILNYVERARESVILDDAMTSDIYGSDEYICSHGCKSVMCLPVINKGELKGLLYLENNLIEGVFDKQRTEALKIIAAQLAISLENVYLFNNLQQLVDDRTRELRAEIAVRTNAEKRLEQMANYDYLTNLPNRRMFQTYLEHAIERAGTNKSNLAVLFIDLDGFKGINDQYGHDKGDYVLVTVAQRLVASVRSCDTVSRMGGDEFVLILENIKTVEEIEIICKRIITAAEMPIAFDDLGVKAVVTSSIGISLLNCDETTAEELISKADTAMYRAKNNGKNQFVFYSCPNLPWHNEHGIPEHLYYR
ncbi:diguanylate cyclase domain-containing protein [Acetobacterium wieringae]|uniref:diguanylate cyclase domain-containing protein n=1 Tax=Acetobacterium wieringae TaxID=52694 RepID=UPI0026EEC333|nr:diguanylate cyclase [Acetobacterium wieringae]